jgi:hypothetical protein
MGSQAMLNNTFAEQNIAIGKDALLSQTFVGSPANAVFPTDNVAVGYQALYTNNPTSNANGNMNTAIGTQSLYGNTTGKNNIAIGYQAMNSNTAMGYNIAIGPQALYSQTGSAISTTYNVAIGWHSLYNSTPTAVNEGLQNVAVGYGTLLNNLQGSYNTALGYTALFTNTLGKYNTGLGYNANVASNSLINATAIGANSVVGASNSMVLGGTGTYSVNVGIGITTPTQMLDVVGGFTHMTYNVQTLPASDAGGGLTVGWNKSSGNAEVNFYNVYNNANTSYLFSQKTGAATSKDLLMIVGDTRLRLFGSTSGYTDIKSPAAGGNILLTLPATAGANGQVLTTDGTGVTTWSNNPFASGSGNMVLLYNDETSSSFTTATTAVKSFTIPSTYTKVKVEADIEYDWTGSAGTTGYTYTIVYNGVGVRTATIKYAAAGYYVSGSVSYTGAVASGQVVQIDVAKINTPATGYVKNFRVYGIY